jgi:ABC-type polysaccharide/polyol phosphate transport system ATPase subunit
MPSLIAVDHVTKEFTLGEMPSLKRTVLNGMRRLAGRPVDARPQFKALNDVSFSVQPGEVLGIIGHNGAGKSTLLKILAGISEPTTGNVAVRGRVAPLIEVGAGLIPDMTGRENIFLNAIILGMRREEVKRRFDEIVAFAELEEFIDTPVKRYSSGMRVRLGFAIATSVTAEILIVDEVLAVGDLAFQRKCFDRMEELIKRDGRTVLLVSHNIRQVERLCDRVIELAHGKLSLDGNPTEVCNHFIQESNVTIRKNIEKHAPIKEETGWDVDLVSLEILDSEGCATDTLRCLDPCRIRVAFSAGTALPRTTFYIGIHTTDFVYLTADNTAYEPREYEPGVYAVELHIDRMALLPGVYCLLVWIGSDLGETYFRAENLRQFTVHSDRYQISRQRDRGLFLLDTSWRLDAMQSQGALPGSFGSSC